MYYSIRHVTKFRYSQAVSESVLDVRMQPRSEGFQRCVHFELRTSPKASITAYIDNGENRVHHFDVPDRHTHLSIRAEALVEMQAPPVVPEHLAPDAWDTLDALTATDEYWDALAPSHYVQDTERLQDARREWHVERDADPLTALRRLNATLHDNLTYTPESTRVDSPIDEALSTRQGVCQDFTHIMLALVRPLGIPCRYVSGYLFHRVDDHDRSARDATHAWVEALLPGLGWVGFDPTNNLVAGDRHIRVAVGRDYADVPPTRGVFKGRAETELAVSVRVLPSAAPPAGEQEEEEESEPSYRATTGIASLPETDLQVQPQQ
ncbi:MAG: transglutaminase family protein [Chloroflexota bacterium]